MSGNSYIVAMVQKASRHLRSLRFIPDTEELIGPNSVCGEDAGNVDKRWGLNSVPESFNVIKDNRLEFKKGRTDADEVVCGV